jgi:Ras family
VGREERYVNSPWYNQPSDAYLLTCDITDECSYEELSNFINTIRTGGRYPQLPIFLVGTKSDLSYDRQVKTQKLEAFAKANNCIFLGETSAKGLAVEEVFTSLAQNFSERFRKEELREEEALKKNLKQNLDEYTSVGNTLVAYLKLIFSFGQFRLGVEKINLANTLKAQLAGSEVKKVIDEYRDKNKKLVESEIKHSWFFSKNYLNTNKINEIILEEGKLGEILKQGSSKQ